MDRHRRVNVETPEGEVEATFEAWAHEKNVPVAIIIYDDGCVKSHPLNEFKFVVNRRHHWEIIEEAKKYPWYDIYYTASYLNK